MPISQEDINHSDVCASFVKYEKSSTLLEGKVKNPSTPEKSLSRIVLGESYLTEDEFRQNGSEDNTTISKSWMFKKPRNIFSRNPMLRKSAYKLCKEISIMHG